jgi:hypothetical protein
VIRVVKLYAHDVPLILRTERELESRPCSDASWLPETSSDCVERVSRPYQTHHASLPIHLQILLWERRRCREGVVGQIHTDEILELGQWRRVDDLVLGDVHVEQMRVAFDRLQAHQAFILLHQTRNNELPKVRAP